MRSWIFVPAIYEKYYNKINDLTSDYIVLDFEDSIPSDKIDTSLDLFKINSKHIKKKNIYARIPHTLVNRKKINQLISYGCQGFVLPKIYDFKILKKLDRILINKNKIKIVLLIETAFSIENLSKILGLSNRIIAIMFGHEDYLLDIKAEDSINQLNLLYARSKIVSCAYSKNLTPIDSPFLNIRDKIGLKKYIKKSKEIGFKGMITLTPDQSLIANDYYLPTKTEYLKSKELINLNKKFNNNKLINFSKGRFIGPPLLKKALINIKLYEKYFQKK